MSKQKQYLRALLGEDVVVYTQEKRIRDAVSALNGMSDATMETLVAKLPTSVREQLEDALTNITHPFIPEKYGRR